MGTSVPSREEIEKLSEGFEVGLVEEVGHGGGGSGRVASATQDSLTKVVLHGSKGERFPPGFT